MKYFTKEVKIALVALLAIVVLFVGLNFLKGKKLFSSDNNFFVRFDNVSGLSASSPVYANGYRVGVVDRIDYDYSRPDQIMAVIGLDKEMQVPRGTRAEIVSDFLGNVKLELRFGERANGLLAPGDTIDGLLQKGALEKAATMIPQVEQMLTRVDSILVCVNALVSDPALASSLHNVDELTVSLSATSQDLNRLVASVGKQVPGMMQRADATLANTETLTRQLSEIDLTATMQRVDATLANVEQMSAALNSKEGTLGLLMRDPQLYQNLSATMRDVDSLLIDFKQHPKRYINVSVFGRKDK